MKKQINQLIAIAEEYARVGEKLRLPFTHNTLRTKKSKIYDTESYQFCRADEDKPIIKLYFGDPYKTVSFTIGKYEVCAWSRTVVFPYDVTVTELKETIIDALLHLELFKEFEPVAKELQEKRNKAEIEELEAKIKELQS